jgi:hypothetical protein
MNDVQGNYRHSIGTHDVKVWDELVLDCSQQDEVAFPIIGIYLESLPHQYGKLL